MKTKFEEFGAKLKATPQKDGKKVALFYYSGHGALKDGKSYLISVDANLPKEETETEALFKKASLAEEMVTDEPSEDNTPEATATEASSSKAGAGLIPLTTLFKEINQVADTTTNLFILDACRDNPLLVAKNDQGQQGATKNIKGLGWSDEVEEEIRRSDQVPDPKNSLIAYATARGEVAQDGEGLNSPYTQRLLEQMKKPGLNVMELFQKVGKQVKQETPQEPWQYGTLDEDFYFVGMEPPKMRGGFR
jgi:uncharacterized caspase-like protein